MQNMPSFSTYLKQTSTDMNLFGSLLHDNFFFFFFLRVLANVNRKKPTVFRAQALHAFYVFDVQRMFVRMF